MIVTAPLKIENGSGSPLRVLALVVRRELNASATRERGSLALSTDRQARNARWPSDPSRKRSRSSISARATSSPARASWPSPRLSSRPACPTSPATRARRSRTSWTCSRTRTTSSKTSASTSNPRASEATAAATLAASVNYPLRGAVTFKSTVGTNVASDALANLASGGVTGGAMLIVGEDYGEGSSIMQERSHAFAMKSQVWLLDPAAEPAQDRRAWWRRASSCRRPRTRR